MNLNDKEAEYMLCKRLGDSDRKAFDALFRDMFSKLVGYAWKYTGQKESASDVVQEAFIKLWKIREDLNPNESIKAYLYSMVRNLSLNHIRDNSRVQTGLKLADLNKEAVQPDFENQDETKKRRMKLIREWISELPERQQQAFMLSRFEGLDHEEISLVMKVSPRTVNNHIMQALKNLAEQRDSYFSNNI